MTNFRTLLICHEPSLLHREGIARWLTSFSNLVGIVVLHEDGRARWSRVRREISRSGVLGFADVLAFRVFYRLRLRRRDAEWESNAVNSLLQRFPPSPPPAILHEQSPNSASAEQFIRERKPDITIALCKQLLAERVFTIPRHGTFVLHPGVCPEYRNAHGCFWALVNHDPGNVGMTLLRVDRGVDTGPVFGYYRYPFEEGAESHVVVQHRLLLENLDAVRERLIEIANGKATPIDTSGRRSAVWGQPRLTRYVAWKRGTREKRRTA